MKTSKTKIREIRFSAFVNEIDFEVYADYMPGESNHTGASILPEDSYEGSPAEIEITGLYLLDVKPEVDLIGVISSLVIDQIEEFFWLHIDEIRIADLEV